MYTQLLSKCEHVLNSVPSDHQKPHRAHVLFKFDKCFCQREFVVCQCWGNKVLVVSAYWK